MLHDYDVSSLDFAKLSNEYFNSVKATDTEWIYIQIQHSHPHFVLDVTTCVDAAGATGVSFDEHTLLPADNSGKMQ